MPIKRMEDRRNPILIVGDAVGAAHFIVAHIAILIGEITSVFEDLGGKYQGLEFVYRYMDAPVYMLAQKLGVSESPDLLYTFMVAEVVIIASSILYGGIAILIIKLFFGTYLER